MTRQKKELIKRIEEIEKEIAIDWDLSFGCAPPGAYDEMNDEIWELQEQLAKLRHYNSAEEMFYDSRWPDPEMGMG